MKDLTLETLIAVFEEIFGPWLFWAMVAIAALITIAFLYVVIRDRTIFGSRFLRAELWAPIGAVAAVLFVWWMTDSGWRDIGGPIDIIVVLLIAIAGAIGLTILAYTILELVFPPKRDES
ncbi:MAG: DUF5368 domain-containing protein [Rhodobacter sp.]|nr:DUF5368 domain-containing protein [Rhodobacter sp.]